MRNIGVILLILGISVVAYEYFPKREVHQFRIGGANVATVETEEQKTDPIPLVIGGLCIIAGLVLVLQRKGPAGI